MKKKLLVLCILLGLVSSLVFGIVVNSPAYRIYATNNNRTLLLQNDEGGRLSVSLAVYTDANNACFYPTLTAIGKGKTAKWDAPSGQKIVSWDESAVRCEIPDNN
ncbi:MAG: hypothetical protein LBL70_06415 [Treponema sp.]|jgi:hypothetical protein|nr:hypothetical protein [Treponema sp.]